MEEEAEVEGTNSLYRRNMEWFGTGSDPINFVRYPHLRH